MEQNRLKPNTVRYAVLMSGGTALLGIMSLWGCGSDSGTAALTGLPGGKATRAQVLRGRYIVTTTGCTDCHNRGTDNPNDAQWMAGYTSTSQGASFAIGPFTTYSANLTPDKATGIGNWTAQNTFNALRNGKDPNGKFLAPPMPWPAIRNMTDDDLWSIVAYLESLKAVSNQVPASQGPPGADGTPDWSSSYQSLSALPSYPAANEVNVP